MVVRLDAAKWRRRRGMARLLDALGAGEGLTRYVGGAVRDELLHLPVSDVDLATRLRPDEVIKRLEAVKIRAVPTGIDHGTITAVSSGHAVEITSLRRDVSTDGRRATVAFTDEESARRGETQEPPADVREDLDYAMKDAQFYDLRRPWFESAR